MTILYRMLIEPHRDVKSIDSKDTVEKMPSDYNQAAFVIIDGAPSLETLTPVIQLCMGLESVGKSQSDHCFPFRRFSNAKPTATRTAPAPQKDHALYHIILSCGGNPLDINP